MHTHKIRSSQRLFKRHIFDPRLFFCKPAGVAEIVHLLHRLHERMILIRRVIAQNIHIEPNALLDESQPDAPRPDHRHSLPGNLIP